MILERPSGDNLIERMVTSAKSSSLSASENKKGTWFQRNRTRGYASAPGAYAAFQWGLPQDHPLRGDFDGDGKADLALYRPGSGQWLVCKSSTGFSCQDPIMKQFGLPGDRAVEVDIDNDGIHDFAVFRPSTYEWLYLRSSDGTFSARQLGAAGDISLHAPVRERWEAFYPPPPPKKKTPKQPKG